MAGLSQWKSTKNLKTSINTGYHHLSIRSIDSPKSRSYPIEIDTKEWSVAKTRLPKAETILVQRDQVKGFSRYPRWAMLSAQVL
jgi:hypothetical protein